MLKPDSIISDFNNPRHKTSFIMNELIPHEEDEKVEYKNYYLPFRYSDSKTQELIDNLKKQFCGFLNNKGGRLYLGINDDRRVVGCNLNSKERDITRNALINFTSDFYPRCRTDKINISIIPVKLKTGEYIQNKFVVKVIVKKGDCKKLYSVSSKFYKSYMRLSGQCVELSCMEIEKELVDRSLKKNEDNLILDDFIDPEPEVNIHLEDEASLPNVSEDALLPENSDARPRRSLGKSRNNLRSKSSILPSHGNEAHGNRRRVTKKTENSEKVNLVSGVKATEINIEISKTVEISEIVNITNKSDETYNYIQKKQTLDARPNKENDIRFEKPVFAFIGNLPPDIKSKQVYDLLFEHQILVDYNYKLMISNHTNEANARFQVINSEEANILREKLNDFLFMNRKLTVS